MPNCRMHVRINGDKARGAERTRDDKRVEGRKGQVFCDAAKADVGARCWTARLVQEAVRPSFAAVGHPQSFSFPRGTVVFHRSLRIFSHLATSTCLGDCLVRLSATLAFSLSFFTALLRPLLLRPLPTLQSLLWLPVLANRSSLFLSLFVPFRLYFAVVSPYFRANGRHEYLNIFPLSPILFFLLFAFLPSPNMRPRDLILIPDACDSLCRVMHRRTDCILAERFFHVGTFFDCDNMHTPHYVGMIDHARIRSCSWYHTISDVLQK